MTREEKIMALLRSLYEYLPGPKVARYGDLPGPAPTTKAPCKSCGGAGHFGKRRRACSPCGGTGQVTVDGYTGEPVGTDEGRVHSADRRRIEAELAALARDEAIRRGRMLDDPFRWEAERIRYRRAGSYAALEVALESLRANHPDLASLVMRCVVYATSEPDESARAAIGQGVAYLSRRMPAEIRVPRWVEAPPPPVERDWPRDRRRTGASRERNAEIIRLAGDGVKGAEIARQVGCSPATVSRVLASVQMSGTAA